MKGGVAITFEEMEMIELDHCNHDLLKGRVVITFYILYWDDGALARLIILINYSLIHNVTQNSCPGIKGGVAITFEEMKMIVLWGAWSLQSLSFERRSCDHLLYFILRWWSTQVHHSNYNHFKIGVAFSHFPTDLCHLVPCVESDIRPANGNLRQQQKNTLKEKSKSPQMCEKCGPGETKIEQD